jgi:methionyl-tRNA formyltransferase
MRLVFAGTPEFARTALAALHHAGHDIALVLTQPDRPAGRGMKLQASAVKQYALDHGMPVCQPHSLRLDGKYPDDALTAQQAIAHANAELMVVVAYGLLLPDWALHSVPKGCLNIHASLLPRWRGAAPIQRAIEAGDSDTGVCIMQMDAGLDTGAVLMRESLPIGDTDTSASLHDKLAALGSRLIVDTLNALPQLNAQTQATEGVTYAAKILKDEALIDWQLPALRLSQRIRAFDPFPGAHTFCNGQVLKIWSASARKIHTHSTPGSVLHLHSDAFDVATGDGVLHVTQVQRPGGKRISAAEFLHSHALSIGMVLGQVAA